MTICVRACTCCLMCTCAWPTDISSIVADISKGFEDLIPSVFEELSAGEGVMLQWEQQHGPPPGPDSSSI